MKAIPLTMAGYDGDYIMYEDSSIFNNKTQKVLKEDKEGRVTVYKKGKPVHKSVKVLYKELFNRYLQRPDQITDLKGEEWKEVNGSNGAYLISNMGRIKTYAKHSKARLMKPYQKTDKPYLSIDLCLEGNRNTVLLSRLVSEYFVEGYSEKKQIHHKDGNPLNNCASNLQAVTPEEHQKLHGKTPKQEKKEGETADDKEVLSSI